MRVAAQDDWFGRSLELDCSGRRRGDRRQGVLVAARGRVAATDGAEPLGLDGERRRPCCDGREALWTETIANPAALLAVILEHDAVGVAAKDPDSVA